MARRATISFGNRTIPYAVRRSAARATVGVSVDSAGRVRVAAPPRLPLESIAAAVMGKAPWIIAQQARLKRLHPGTPPRRFVSGESIPYLGRHYQLVVRPSRDRRAAPLVRCSAGRLHVEVPPRAGPGRRTRVCREALVAWLRDRALEHAARHCRRASQRAGLPVPNVAIRDLGARWGSCTRGGRVLVHWRTIMAPMPLVEYVCAHEVCHLAHPDHSPAFRRLLSRVLPDWPRRAAQLATRGRRFDL